MFQMNEKKKRYRVKRKTDEMRRRNGKNKKIWLNKYNHFSFLE